MSYCLNRNRSVLNPLTIPIRSFPTQSISTRKISTRTNWHPINSRPIISHQKNCHPISSHPNNFSLHSYTAALLHRCHFSTNYNFFMTALCTKLSVCMASVFYLFHILHQVVTFARLTFFKKLKKLSWPKLIQTHLLKKLN